MDSDILPIRQGRGIVMDYYSSCFKGVDDGGGGSPIADSHVHGRTNFSVVGIVIDVVVVGVAYCLPAFFFVCFKIIGEESYHEQ